MIKYCLIIMLERGNTVAWVVIVSVVAMTVLCLLRVNVIVSIIIAAVIAGVMGGLTIPDSIELLVSGMGEQSQTALSYILLGGFAVAISYSGITTLLVRYLIKMLRGKKTILVLVLAGVASLSQNVIPVHIAFIPILIPPLLSLFDQMKLDRRAMATALTFGLKAPYVMIPVGFGLMFHEVIYKGMNNNGASITMGEIALSMLIPGIGMIVGLFIAVLFTYRKDRIYEAGDRVVSAPEEEQETARFELKHGLTIIAILAALIAQIVTGQLIIGALTGLLLMLIFFVVPFKQGDEVVTEGIRMMGMIAFVMLVAAGYGHVLTETGAVEALVNASSGFIETTSQGTIAFLLLAIGLVITLGIGSSFGTIPIIATLFVPICLTAGFSPLATAALIGTAGALGDAGSPASDSTLGPTSGLNADGKHNHIWDTCVPTFIHFNIPLFLFGWIAAMVL